VNLPSRRLGSVAMIVPSLAVTVVVSIGMDALLLRRGDAPAAIIAGAALFNATTVLQALTGALTPASGRSGRARGHRSTVTAQTTWGASRLGDLDPGGVPGRKGTDPGDLIATARGRIETSQPGETRSFWQRSSDRRGAQEDLLRGGEPGGRGQFRDE
jgi:hypothetical protein